MDFNSLPTEMLQHIFSYLSADELCRLTGQVCKYWRNVSYEPVLWREVHLNGLIQSPNEIMLIAKSCSLARRLKLSRISKSKWKFTSVLPVCKSLRSIEFNDCSFNETCVERLVEASPLNERMHSEYSRSIDYTTLCQIVKWTNLKTLLLNDCKLLPEGNTSVVLIANECKKLENLELGFSWSLDNSSLSYLIKLRGSMLKSLFISCEELSTDEYKFLTKCPHISDLRLCRAINMTNRELMYIKQLHFLRKLNLSGTVRLTEEDFTDLFEETSFYKIEELSFHCCNIDDIALSRIPICCPVLKYFRLDYCHFVSSVGMEHFITNCSTMEHLSLNCIRLRSKCLAKIPETMPNLVRLDVCQCLTRPNQFLQELKSKKPNLEIYGYGGKKI